VETIRKLISAVHYNYKGGAAQIDTTSLYFDDGTKLELNGHWVFVVGQSYIIEHSNGNPVDIQSVKLARMEG